MNKSTRKNSVYILSCLLAGATLLLACLLIGHCVQIYRTGVAPENLTEAGVRIMDIYSPAVIARHARQIAWAFCLWLALLAAAALACLRHPQDVRILPGMKSAPKRLPEPFAAKDARSPRLTRCLLLAAAITLIALGVLNGGMRDVLVKAINICTECIGLG